MTWALMFVLLVSCAGDGDSADVGDGDLVEEVNDGDIERFDADASDAEVGGDDAGPDGGEPSEFPVSSSCLSEIGGDRICRGGVWAESWDRSLVFRWRLVDESTHLSRITSGRADDGSDEVLLADVESPSAWHIPMGITADGEGGVVISGTSISETIRIGDVDIELPHTYQTFVVQISGAGMVGWEVVVEGVTSELSMVAMRADGSTIIAGDHHSATMVGEFDLRDPEWVYDFWIAAIDGEGEWLWAAQTPEQGDATGDFQFMDLELAPTGGELWVHGWMRGELTIAGETFECLDMRCEATMVFDSGGRALAIEGQGL